jgi:2-oxoglutarate ferredoxin oxidoreductase subunit delta
MDRPGARLRRSARFRRLVSSAAAGTAPQPWRTIIATVHAAENRVHRAPTIVDYVNIRWVDEWCKRCNICVEICPKDSLLLSHDAIIEATDCIRCGLCERYCPDLAISVLPKRDEQGNLPPEAAVENAPAGARAAVPRVARGPAVAGTDPHRGMTDAESAPEVDRDNPT